jgi:phosphopentomutase
MPNTHDQLPNIRIATPCQTSWESMAGDERVRHCTLCSLNVYNFAEMTRHEVRELLARTEGRVCARLYRRADGTVIRATVRRDFALCVGGRRASLLR